jgi:hypothetical protein
MFFVAPHATVSDKHVDFAGLDSDGLRNDGLGNDGGLKKTTGGFGRAEPSAPAQLVVKDRDDDRNLQQFHQKIS